MEMKIEVFTLCWNEMDVLPWVVDYWEKFASHVTVFDNGSTDGSKWFLERFDWIEVNPFETDGFNDTVHQRIKDQCWRGSDADFVVVCDMDECLIAKDIMSVFKRMKEEGATLCKPNWYELHSDEVPIYESGKALHEVCPSIPLIGAAKTLVIDPKAINHINYSAGAHRCDPEGRIKWYENGDLYCLHINHNLSLDYKLSKYKQLDERLSEENRRKHHGIHYGFSKEILERAWIEDKKRRCNLNDIING